MLYESTRGTATKIPSHEAIRLGLSPDGGLFVPSEDVIFSPAQIESYVKMSYNQRAKSILKTFLTDYTDEEIEECVESAYSVPKFSSSDIAHLKKINNTISILELWHGPTCAFKDMALQVLPHLLVKAIRKSGEKSEVAILVATSGDTGKAALEGFKDIDGTKIIVFYPSDGVSEVQKLQMVTQEGKNVSAIAVNGNFDDAQTGVKTIFGDEELCKQLENKGYTLSSANSINWGRLVPQIVYYFSAYADMISNGTIKNGEKVNFVVPTGNFGNILAAYYSKKMGLPVNKLICASNQNNILTDFINTGTYNKNRQFHKTISPSMDILISSNLERLLFDITERDASLIRLWMDKLRNENCYTIDAYSKKHISELFWADFATDDEAIDTIRSIYNEYGYVMDTHTAVAVNVYDKYVISTGDITKTVIVSTASPFKFNASVATAIFGDEMIQGKTDFELLKMISENLNLNIPNSLDNLDKKPVLHTKSCGKDELKENVIFLLTKD